MSRKQHSDETKAAVMAALLAGQTVSFVAKEYNIPSGTVKSWKHKANRVAEVAPQKKRAIGDKLIDLLDTMIDTLIKQHETVVDPEWILRQSAADLAVYTGVVTDKVMRMLEAFGSDDDADDNQAED